MKISILSYSFRGLLQSGEMDVFGFLETCRYRYGLGWADIWSGHFTSTEEDFVLKIKNALEERDLKLADIAVDQAHVWDADEATREACYARAKRFLEISAALGTRVMRLDAGSRNESWTSEEFDFIVKRYKEYCQFAHDHGFVIAIENHWGPERSFENLKAVYKAVDSPAFGVSCHFHGWTGDDAAKSQQDALAAPWVVHTHIPWNVCSDPALLKEKLTNLWNVGYKGSYSVEHHTGKDEYTEVAIQLAQVRDMLDRIRRGVA